MTSRPTPADLEALIKLAANMGAVSLQYDSGVYPYISTSLLGTVALIDDTEGDLNEEAVEQICAAANAAPALVARVRELSEALRLTVEALEKSEGCVVSPPCGDCRLCRALTTAKRALEGGAE